MIGGGWWIYPYWQKSRADTFAADADDELEARRLAEAEEQVETALKMRPGDTRYLRLAGRIFGSDHNPKAVEFFQALLRTADATERDRYEFIELALRLKKPELAQQLVNQMISAQGVSAKTEFYAAALAEARHDIPKAIELARASISHASRKESIWDRRVLLGRVLLASGDKDKIEEGKRILMGLAANSDRGRLPAIRALVSTELSTNELQQLVRWMKVTYMPRLEDLFLGYELLYRLDTNNIATLGRDVAEKFTSGRAEEQIALGAWLNSHGLFEQTLKALGPEPDLKNGGVAAIYLDALMGAGKWEEALKLAERLEGDGGKEEARAAFRRLATNAPTAEAAKADLARLRAPNGAKLGSQ